VVKLIVFHRRRGEVSVEDWNAVWRGAYLDGLGKLPGSPRVVLDVPVPGQDSTRADGIDEVEWDDLGAAREAVGGAWLRYLIERASAIQAEGWPCGGLFDERVVMEPPARGAGAKRMGMIHRLTGLDAKTFDARWRDEHGPLVLALPGIAGYVQQVAVQPVTGLAGLDGVAVLWFADRAAAEQAFAGPAGEAARADAAEIMDAARVAATHVEERDAAAAVVVEDAPPGVWRNWSGLVRCQPQRIEMPRSEAELIAAVRRADREGLTVRVAGTGHSFTPLCASDGLLLSLDGMTGLVSASRERVEATAWAGTTIHDLGPLLHAHGLAMENMGDIDRQTLGGAVGTGTHGTGRELGSISTQVLGLRLITARGEVVDCSATEEPELWRAARVSLGALGVISQVRLRLVPAFRLHEMRWDWPFDRAMAALDRMISDNHHFEYFWNPQTDLCAMKSLNPTWREPGDATAGQRIDWSHRVFPSERTFRFNEMEFALPAERGPECVRAVRALMRERFPDVAWPIEYRTLAADDIPLSPASGRATVTISVHQAAQLDHRTFFGEVEDVFRAHGGRPHWGKLHTHRAAALAALYLDWPRFQAVRRRLDPDGRFLNPHLRQLLDA